jgi:hypothetical protein
MIFGGTACLTLDRFFGPRIEGFIERNAMLSRFRFVLMLGMHLTVFFQAQKFMGYMCPLNVNDLVEKSPSKQALFTVIHS